MKRGPWWAPPATRARRYALVLALGLAGANLPFALRAQGLVIGVLGTAVSPAPGQPPSQRLQGGLALRLNRVDVAGQVWSQLLASDGRHGWTPMPLGAELPVTAQAADRAFELMPLPPGHADFLASVGQPIAPGATARLLGGSLASEVADMQDKLIPPWLGHSLAPWLRWAMAGVEGYAPLPAVALWWRAPQPAQSSGAAAAGQPRLLLGQWGLQGLSRAAFLAPLAPQLQRLAPAPGARALDLSAAPGTPATQRPLQGSWTGPLAAYRGTADKAGSLATLLIFGQDKARALVLLGAGGETMLAYAEEDQMSLARLVEADLDGDGLAEWLLEMVGVYGDGFYSELWIVDGRSSRAGLRIHRLPLSRGSGEVPAKAQDAAWWNHDDGSLWIWRSTPTSSQLGAWRYTRLGGPQAVPRRASLVLLGTDSDHVAGRQRQLQALASSAGAVLLPRQTPSGLQWLTAVPASSAALAARWAASQGLPTHAVKTLPWRP